ncbi:MAG TPA: hypothetical protein VKZ49_11770 [Polyangiaceae bacterium]|nr:hypothetical protein [Polyangiaceae bacterium]
MATATRDIRRVKTRPDSRDIWGPGVIAGIVSAMIMLLFGMIVWAARGLGFWGLPKAISAVFLGTGGLSAGLGAVILGLAIHSVLGALFGILFAALLPKGVSAGAELAAALLFGVAVFVIMTYFVLPWANPILYSLISQAWFFAYHLVFGLGLALVLPIRRGLHMRGHRPVQAGA